MYHISVVHVSDISNSTHWTLENVAGILNVLISKHVLINDSFKITVGRMTQDF